ncbi:MAG: arylsulfatase A-like enzyme [Saprospiraceae bacterium]|jgi:arylsulfatase A-like enzyme
MNRDKIIKMSKFICIDKFIISLLVVLSYSCNPSLEKDEMPNIIMIMTDDLGWRDTGFNGNRIVQTPHLDRLAGEGVIFDRFYAASPVCSPTRASFLTGRNPLRMNIPNANSGHMLQEEITIPELLKEVGYATGHYGKWHLGTLTKKILDANRGGKKKLYEHFTNPADHGYDEFFCTESKVPTHDPMIKPTEYEGVESLRYGWQSIDNGDSSLSYGTSYWTAPEVRETTNLEGSNARIIMDRVIPFINRSNQSGSPFFSTIWFHTPHLPVATDDEHREVYSDQPLDIQLYYGAITAMDEQVGRLWSELERLNIDDNTILWFCSDNGPENGTPGSAGPFRERKRSLYEGGVRVPSFVMGKGVCPGGNRVLTPTLTSDYLPTIVELLGLTYPEDHPLDGVSILPFINESVQERKGGIGFIYKDYDKVSWVSDRYKYISTNGMQDFELYDLLIDPSESQNIITQKPSVASKMKTELEEWLTSVSKSSNGEDY